MQILRARTVVFAVGVLMGLGGTAGVLYLLQNETTTPLGNLTNVTKELEPLTPSNTANSSDTSELLGNVAVPSLINDIVFPKHAFSRKATLNSWVASLSDDQVISWLEQSTEQSWQVSIADRTELQTTLLQKLSITAPESALELVLARDDQQRASMISVIFAVWAGTNLNGAVARAKEMDEREAPTILSAILESRDDLPLARQRQIARELGNENVAFSNYFQSLTRSKVENPKDTWYKIVNLANRERVQDTTGEALSGVAVAWVEEQGLTVLAEILSSISNDSEYSNVLSQIFGALSADRPEEIFDFVMSNLGDQAQQIIQRSRIVYNWTRKDPRGMLSKAETLPRSGFRSNLVSRAVMQWAENNPRQILEQLELVPREHRAEASRSAVRTFTRNSPGEAANFVLKIPDYQSQLTLANTLVQEWSDQDPDATKDWVFDLPENDRLRSALIERLVRELVYPDPRTAFQLALEQPVEEQKFSQFPARGLESSILSSIAHYDTELAVELLPQVRDIGRSKISAYSTVGSILIQRGETQQAISLANRLSGKEQTRYCQSVASTWAMEDPQGMLKAFDDFPTETKSRVALTIRVSSVASRTYSEIEIAWLENHISDEDSALFDQLKEIDMENPSPADREKLRELYSW